MTISHCENIVSTSPEGEGVDFELTDDQLELRRVVREIAERECPAGLLRAVLDGTGRDDALWKTYVELDWPSLVVPEAAGGLGLGVVEQVLVLEELGRVADPTPFLATTSQYLPLVRWCGDAGQQSRLLGRLVGGGTGAAAFHADVEASRSGGGWVVGGTARAVLDGDRADEVAVVATTDDVPTVFVVPAAAVSATRTTTFDGTLHVADVVFDGAAVDDSRVLRSGGETAIATARAQATAGMAAATVGASQRAFELALAHIRDRKQFGVPIGSFQALKHMAADAFVAIERARAVHQFAALAIDERDGRRFVAASMAKAAAGDAQRIATQHAVQFFGGLGFTWENDLHLYVRRAKAGELLLGTSAEHRVRIAREVLPT
jgi:alkylation response protein AidB-like acyl-CoA dehydrogenase